MNSSSAATRVGAQRPTHLLTPDGRFDFSDGDDAIQLSASMGLHLFDWQRWLVRWILAVDGDGRPACNTVILVVPRQNGKGAILECLELYWMLVAGVNKVVHTAHEADTAGEHMERIDAYTTDPDIELPYVHTYKSNGKERTLCVDEDEDGNTQKMILQYRTRTKATKRGASPNKVVLDESQELQSAHLAALVPAMAAQSMDESKLPQLIYTGSAPLEHSHYMHGLLAKVQDDRPPRTLLAMWACVADADHTDVDNWYLTNPSLGLLISEEWIRETEYLVMDAEDFGAERLGIAKKPVVRGVSVSPIDPEAFSKLVSVNVEYDKATAALAVAVAYDRSWSTISAVGKRPDGLVQGKVVAMKPGTGWVAERVAELAAERKGTVVGMVKDEPLVDDVEKAGVTVTAMSGADQARASQSLIDACSGGIDDEDGLAPTFRHRGEPALATAVGIAVPKPYGGGNMDFDNRKSPGDISPLKSMAMAYALCMTAPAVKRSVYEDDDLLMV